MTDGDLLDPLTLRWVADRFESDAKRRRAWLKDEDDLRRAVLRGRARWLRNLATRAANAEEAARVEFESRQAALERDRSMALGGIE